MEIGNMTIEKYNISDDIRLYFNQSGKNELSVTLAYCGDLIPMTICEAEKVAELIIEKQYSPIYHKREVD